MAMAEQHGDVGAAVDVTVAEAEIRGLVKQI
jgi:hypothetical protein